MDFFSMFSGIGGFDLALTRHGHRPIGCSEIERHAASVYARHFQEVTNYGDATKIDPDALPRFDLLVGGFPCQSFSTANRTRRGFGDARGQLFFQLARLLEAKQPDFFIFENVKGLLTIDEGRTFETILTTLDGLGYRVQWQVINSNGFTPQNRERVYIVGHSGTVSWRPILPIRTETNGVIRTVHRPARMYKTRHLIYSIEGVAPCITCDVANGLLLAELKRRATPRELERLQGFPDDWTRYDADGEEISDRIRYTMIGNAVTVPVVEEIVRRLSSEEIPNGQDPHAS